MPARILVLDIETQSAVVETFSLWDAPASIQKIVEPVKVLCFAAQWRGEKNVEFFSEWEDGHQEMIEAAWSMINDADFVVSWNGRKFDIPHLRYEFLLAGLTPPSPHKDIDLFQIAKRNFRAMSNKLDWYGQQVLNDRKVKHDGISLWQTLRRPESEVALLRAQKKMRAYNIKDVRLTTRLFETFLPWIPNLNIVLADEKHSADSICTRCGSEKIQWRGNYLGVSYSYPRFVCTDCGGWGRGKRSYYSTEMRPC